MDENSISFKSNKLIDFTKGVVFFYAESLSIIFKTNISSTESMNISIEFPNEIQALSEKENLSYSQSTNQIIKGTTEIIKDENFSQDFAREKITTKPLSGKVGDTDKLGGHLKGKFQTEKISSHMSANLKTDNISTKQSVKNLNEEEVFSHQRAAPRARPKAQKKVTLHLKDKPETIAEYDLFDLSMGGLSFVITNKDTLQQNDILDVIYFDQNKVEDQMLGVIRNIREEGVNVFRVGVQFLTDD